MKKNTGKDEAVKADVIFHNDALVLDYLNSLLTSAPAMTMESGETHFVRLAIDAGWKQTDIAEAFVSTATVFENQLSRMEADALEFENKNLKLQAELASIDAQVLRSENHDLKMEIACLTAELNEMKSVFDEMFTESSDLKSRIDSLQNQLTASTINQKNETPHEEASSEPIADKAAGEDIDPDSGHDVQLETAEAAADQQEEPGLDPVEHQESRLPEISEEVLPEPVTAVQQHQSGSGIAADMAFVSQVQVPSDRADQKVERNVLILARNPVSADTQSRSARHSSKIIKQQQADVKKDLIPQESDRIITVLMPNPVQHYAAAIDADWNPDPLPQQDDRASEIEPEDGPVQKTDALHPVGDAEIDMEHAPDPKVVVRRNVKNYQDLQNEADSADKKAGHTIVL